MTKKNILFVSHTPKQCGVYEFGKNLFEAIQKSEKYNFIKVECESKHDLDKAIIKNKPDAIFYNYHPAVMPWVCTKKTKGIYKNNISEIELMQIAMIHEITQKVADNASNRRDKYLQGDPAFQWNSLFDFYVAADPTLLLKNEIVFKTGRLIPDYHNNFAEPEVLTVGSFGFGTANKGFEKIIEKVQEEFDEAIIRLNIPFANFGDSDGAHAKKIAAECKKRIRKDGIKLEISHSFLNDDELLGFLAQNTINVFLYEDKQNRGISSTLDFALAVKRPLALSGSTMFRHIIGTTPSINTEHHSLKSILEKGTEPTQIFRDEWDQKNMTWEIERIIDAAFIKFVNKPKLSFAKKVKGFIKRKVTGKNAESFTWLRNTDAVHEDNMEVNKTIIYTGVGGNVQLNRILDDAARKLYEPTVNFMMTLVPSTMSKKIARANVQQAFVFDTVYRFIKGNSAAKLLCVGSYEDTASMSLLKMGYKVEEIDPMINYFLQDYFTKPTVKKENYDIIFSTSVIEHDPHDESFIKCMEGLLAPGGIAVITCDYKDGWKPGELKPDVDARLYTKNDLETRLPSYLSNSKVVSKGEWDCPEPDFILADKYRYTFATFVFQKNK